MHLATYDPCTKHWCGWMERDWTRKQKGRKRQKRHRYLVAISWYYLHLPGEMRWLVCNGRHLYPDKWMGTGILARTYVTYLYIFHFFVGKCARAARERELDIVGRRIKPGFYYKRIQIPRTRPSPYSALRGGVRRGIVERREKDYTNIKKKRPDRVNPPAPAA